MHQEKSIYFVPWLTEQTTGLIVVAIVGLIKLLGGTIQVKLMNFPDWDKALGEGFSD